MFKKNGRKGFTLIEIIVVLVIMAIMAVIAVPSLMSYMESGRQTGRDNIARTVFLAAQSGLSRMKMNGQLNKYVEFVEKDGTETVTIKDPTVSKVPIDISTNTDPTKDDSANKDYMYYITIENGVGDTFKALVDSYLADKSILADSLVLEFNAKTGVVKSVFYAQNLGTEVWNYNPATAGDPNRGNLVSRADGELRAKKQGFYGVATTGVVSPDVIPISVALKDGSSDKLEGIYTNVLYVEATVPKNSDKNYTIDVGLGTPISFAPASITATSINGALSGNGYYKLTGSDPLTDTIIWILDIVDGTGGSSIIGNMPQNISAVLTEGETGRLMQSNTHNSHFASEQGGGYTVADTRHLNNVRFALDGTFYQTVDIDISDYNENTLPQFEPLSDATSPFIGKYYATKSGGETHKINDLTINGGGVNTGLFGVVQGGEIRGVSLRNAEITATGGNLGGIVGTLSGGTVAQCSSYANVTGTGAVNTGGLVGEIAAAGTLEQSYNGGYDNAPFDVNGVGTSSDKVGNVNADGGNIGGLVGKSAGTIKNSYNNARVNIKSVSVDGDNLSFNPVYFKLNASANLGGIVGQNVAGQVQFCYATNFVAGYADSKSGGIVGDGASQKCLYLGNGSKGDKSVSKATLQKMTVGSAFLPGSGYVPLTPTTADVYPYPHLASNKHSTKWEDIKDTAAAASGLRYYERYNDGTFAYSSEGTDTLAKPTDKVTITVEGIPTEVDKLITNDGYCIDFAYAKEYNFYFGTDTHGKGWLYKLVDTANNSDNPVWEWDMSQPTNSVFNNKPIKYTSGGEARYRLYIDNYIVESIFGVGAQPIRIQVLDAGGKRVLEGSADADTVTGDPAKDVYFNPLFAGAIFNEQETPPPAQTIYTIRSPRQLNNIGWTVEKKSLETLKLNYKQNANMDFEIYRKELSISGDTVSLYGNKMDFAGKIDKYSATVVRVDSEYFNAAATYDGGYCYMRKLEAGNGIFYASSGTIQNIILIDSTIDGSGNTGYVGSIVAVNSGTVRNCEVSDVMVKGNYSVGGVVGESSTLVENVYFNSTYRDPTTGVYATPISGTTATSVVGGLVGMNVGALKNSYITAVGPAWHPVGGERLPGHPTIGGGNSATSENNYYLTVTGYNSDVVTDINQGKALRPEEWGEVFKGKADWEVATEATTLETFMCRGLAYPFPKLKGMNHYFDWPILDTSLKYYERYHDGSYGYFYMAGEGKSVDALKYDPVYTVVEEGYLIDVITRDNYNIRFGSDDNNDMADAESVLFDGRRAIILPHSKIDGLIESKNITANGIIPVKIRASSVETKNDAGVKIFANELYGTNTSGFVYFDPLFANQIFLSDDKKVPDPVGKRKAGEEAGYLVVRSPRQMLNINTSLSTIARTYDYKQMLSINFARGRIAQRDPYVTDVERNPDGTIKKGGKLLNKVDRNVISGLLGTYDGGFTKDENGKPRYVAKQDEKGYRIYYLTMNVPDISAEKNTGSTFGDIGSAGNSTAFVKNLELVDTQIRYTKSGTGGMGGGAVANVCYGTIDNVRVYNLNPMNLFTNQDGGVDTQFCADRATKKTNTLSKMTFAHAHGGIAGIVYGDKAKVTNCVVGTNSDDINQIVENLTTISCYSIGSDTNAGSPAEDRFILVGGIVGGISGGAEVISCANVAKVEANASMMNTDSLSTHCVGGIAGRLGNRDRTGIKSYTSYGNIVGCYNSGSIRIPAPSFGYVGGIVGRTAGVVDGKSSNVTSCYNTGRVNIEKQPDGTLRQTPYKGGNSSLRLGGIAGEVDLTEFKNCYNVGYISGVVPPGDGASAAGAIFGLPTYGNNIVFDCYSLAADQYRPKTIIGNKMYDKAKVNGFGNTDALKAFIPFWETRMKLRNNAELTSKTYTDASTKYPSKDPWSFAEGNNKNYPVFNLNSNAFYYYPQLTSFTYEGKEYKNPHIAPWERIDAEYDTTLKYYEKYADNSFGYYNLSARDEKVSSLKDNSLVVEDGYFLETGRTGRYKVFINDVLFTRDTTGGKFGASNVIEFDKDMKAKMNTGYNKIRVFTTLNEKDPVNGSQNKEDNKINRLVGTSTTFDGTTGQDLYFDWLFPKEIKLADIKANVPALSPAFPNNSYAIRSPRHIDNIGVLIKAGKADEKIGFKQEVDISFSGYNFDSYPVKGYDTAEKAFTRSIVEGKFGSTYDGGNKSIIGVKILSDKGNIGLFENNFQGIIKNLKLEGISYIGSNANLTMGAVAAENSGDINHIAVIDPKLESKATTGAQTIGGLVGKNTSKLTDAYLAATSQDALCPITSASTSTATVGGIVGNSIGTEVQRLLYLAIAPNSNPIAGVNTDTFKDTYYLAGEGYNALPAVTTGGEPKTTKQFTELRDALPKEWKTHWGKSGDYPYPSLTSITPPKTYPTAGSPSFSLAYYEKYALDKYGWFIDGGAGASLKDDGILESGYAIIVEKAGDYTYSINGGAGSPATTTELDGKNIIKLTGTTAATVTLKQGVVEVTSEYNSYNPLFAKSIAKSTEAAKSFAVRAPEQLQNIGKLAVTEGLSFTQERDLDFSGIALANSIVTGEFKGSYNGNGKSISNVTINASVDDVGIFSKNSGTIQNVKLFSTSAITGKNNVGGIVGRNLLAGKILAVEVRNTALTGTADVGAICGKNENVTPQSVTGKWEKVVINGGAEEGGELK